MSKNKVDLTVLKRLVSELESELATADGINTSVSPDKVEWVVSLNKATGLAAGVMSEAAAVMGDIQHLIVGDPSLDKQDFLDKLLGGFKGPGNTN